MWIKSGENTLINLDNVTSIGIYENEEDGYEGEEYEENTPSKRQYGVTLNFTNNKQTILLFDKGQHRKFFDILAAELLAK